MHMYTYIYIFFFFFFLHCCAIARMQRATSSNNGKRKPGDRPSPDKGCGGRRIDYPIAWRGFVDGRTRRPVLHVCVATVDETKSNALKDTFFWKNVARKRVSQLREGVIDRIFPMKSHRNGVDFPPL